MKNAFVSVAKDFKLNKQFQVSKSYNRPRCHNEKHPNTVLVLSSEKCKLAVKTGQQTLAPSGSLIYLCNAALDKGFICFFPTWMCLCQMNELPLPSSRNAPKVLRTQCPSHKSTFPSNCLSRLHSLCHKNKDNMKNYARASTNIFDYLESRTNALFLLHTYVYQTNVLQTVNAVSFRCCSNLQTIRCSSTVVSTGSPTFLLPWFELSKRSIAQSWSPDWSQNPLKNET